MSLPLGAASPRQLFKDENVSVVSGDNSVRYIEAPTQQAALDVIASFIDNDAMDPGLQALARALTARCPARDDWAELKAIYQGVKSGRSDLAPFGLARGLRYMADARTGADGAETDVFFAPSKVLAMLKAGQNGFDCDDATMFVGALAKNCGFRVGARAYGEGDAMGYEHVYPVALIPKRGPWKQDKDGRYDESHVVGLDITVPEARVGWQPPRGDVYTEWLD